MHLLRKQTEKKIVAKNAIRYTAVSGHKPFGCRVQICLCFFPDGFFLAGTALSFISPHAFTDSKMNK